MPCSLNRFCVALPASFGLSQIKLSRNHARRSTSRQCKTQTLIHPVYGRFSLPINIGGDSKDACTPASGLEHTITWFTNYKCLKTQPWTADNHEPTAHVSPDGLLQTIQQPWTTDEGDCPIELECLIFDC